VRTRYTFFNVGDAAGKVRVERTISFSAASQAYSTPSMRAYIPRLPLGSFPDVVHPNAAGTALVTESSANPAQAAASWNQKWVALNNPGTNVGVLILRETTNSARLMLENNGSSNSSSVDLLKPAAGWKAPVTETEWLCPYDADSWNPDARSPTDLPSQCSVVPVPLNTVTPAISGQARVTSTLTGNAGSWDRAASLAYQWERCAGGACAAIPGATSTTYTLGLADEGKQLRFDVTGRATGGEEDTASSPLTGVVQAGPPQNTALPTVSGEARQDETLTGTTGGWSASPTSFQYQWLRCATAVGTSCVDVPGATQSTYKLLRDDVGATMRLRVRAVNAAGSSLPADSAPTGEVQRAVIRASLSISPDPSCTGVRTRFDGSASKTPNAPITRYRLTYKILPTPEAIALIFGVGLGGGDVPAAIDKYLATQPSFPISDGQDPAPASSFTWNRQLADTPVGKAEADLVSAKVGDYARDEIYATLTVTDAAGATNSVTRSLSFAQLYSSEKRTNCPHVRIRRTRAFAFAKLAALSHFSAKAFAAKIPCKTIIDCAGGIAVVRVTRRFRRAAKAAKAKPIVLASNPFFSVRGKHRATVRAKLTKAGRALVKRGKPLRAVVRLTSINPVTGRRTTQSTRVTWPGKKKKRRKKG
jgi:hypothetical protein